MVTRKLAKGGGIVGEARPVIDVRRLKLLRDAGDDLQFQGWVLYYLACGWSTAEVADRLDMSQRGISDYVTRDSTSPARWARMMERSGTAAYIRSEFERSVFGETSM